MARTIDFKKLAQLLIRNEDPQSASLPVSKARREFLQKTTLGGIAAAAYTTSGCSTLDKWFLGEGTRAEGEIIVVGGGLAGLTAAYHLKRNHTAYRLYEASDRLGGRVQTLHHFNSDKQFAESGAEFFEDSHRELIQLCREVNLKTQDISFDAKADRAVYWMDGRVIAEKDFRKALRPLASKLAQLRGEILSSVGADLRTTSLTMLPQAQAADKSSLGELISSFKGTVPAGVLESFENICASEWGVDVTEINLLQFLVRLTFEERALASSPSKVHRIEGGNSRLVQVLGDRVQGVLASFAMKLENRLVEVKARGGGYECVFETPKGHDKVWAKQVICTLPWSLLKEVEGLRDLQIPQSQIEAIESAQYAVHAKTSCSFKEASWRKKKSGATNAQGIFRGQLLGQAYWETSRDQEGSHGIMTSQRGGKRARAISSDSSVIDMLQDLRRFAKDLGPAERSNVTEWEKKPFAKGSRLHCGPGKYLKHLEMLNTASESSGFYFAGEHLSFKDAGTMNGAVATAIAAANLAMKKAHEKASK